MSRGSSRFFFHFPLSFFLCPRSTGHHRGRRYERSLPVQEFPGSNGGSFFLSSPRRKWESRRTIRECLICGYNGLLYEILILEDIQQAYIWLACKSSPYLISRGCEIWWLRGMMARFMLQPFLYFFPIFFFFFHRLLFVKFGHRTILNPFLVYFRKFWTHCDFDNWYFIKSYWQCCLSYDKTIILCHEYFKINYMHIF